MTVPSDFKFGKAETKEVQSLNSIEFGGEEPRGPEVQSPQPQHIGSAEVLPEFEGGARPKPPVRSYNSSEFLDTWRAEDHSEE